MRSYFSLVIATIAINTDLFAAEAGMPQLDPKYWASQAFWLILIFTILYISIAKFYLPKIKNNLDNRENKIKDDVDDANKFKDLSESKFKEYEKILADAKKEVIKIQMESKNILDKDIQSKKEAMEKEIENEISKAQKEINELKRSSLNDIQNISENITSSIKEYDSILNSIDESIRSISIEINEINIAPTLTASLRPTTVPVPRASIALIVV